MHKCLSPCGQSQPFIEMMIACAATRAKKIGYATPGTGANHTDETIDYA